MASDAQPDPLVAWSSRLEAAVAGTARAVVAVHAGRVATSGFVWRPGLVVTAAEAIEVEQGIAVTLPDGRRTPATLVGQDPATDVALLRIDDQGTPALPLAPGAEPALGTLALAVGRRGDDALASFGVVALAGGPWRSLRGGRIDRLIRLDLRLDRHGAGGMAVDAAGRPIGMVVFGPRRSVLAIPPATLAQAAARLLEKGRVGRGYLGLALQPVRIDGEPAFGAMVMAVAAGGPGHEAGLVQGDIVTHWAGEPLTRLRTLLNRLDPESIGQAVELTVRRTGQPLRVVLTVGERPAP